MAKEITFFVDDDSLIYWLFPNSIYYPSTTPKVEIRDESVVIDEDFDRYRLKDPDIIYVRKQSLLNVQYDFSDRESIIKFIDLYYDMDFNWRYKSVFSMTDEEFYFFVKTSLVLHEWYFEFVKNRSKVYKLFEKASSTSLEFLKSYFPLSKRVPEGVVFSSLLTFLENVIEFDSVQEENQYSKYYSRILEKADKKFKDQYIKKCINFLFNLKSDLPLDLRMLAFYIKLV